MLFFKKQLTLKQLDLYIINELKYKILKILIRYLKLKYIVKSLFLTSYNKIYFKTICSYSYRNKSIIRIFKASRIQIRNLNNISFFFGFYKRSW